MLSPQSLSIEPPRRDRITAISSAVQRRPIVLVLGMHRSGTSLCSHILSALGLDMADEIAGPWNTSVTPDNPRGHWERWEIVEFHDRILSLFNRDYLGRFHDFALPVAWWADPRVAQIRREIIAFLEKRMDEGYFGFKDPRTVRLMPVWYQIFNELKLAPKLVLCLRNPAQIGRSLNAREGLDPETGEYRWLVHMIDFFRYASKYDFCTIEYEEWFSNPSVNVEKLQKFLDLLWQQSEADLALVLSDIIDPALRHDDSGHREANQPLVRTFYKLARDADRDGARDQIAYIISQFVGFQQLQRPFIRAFEDVAKVAAKFPEVEHEAAGLRAAVGERDAAIAAGDLRSAAVEARLAEREGALAELSRRADELLTTLQAAQAEAAVREAALTQAERRAQQHVVEAAAVQEEIAALRQEAAERGAAATAMQAEVAALRHTLAQAEREAQERAADATALQSEMAGLRDTLAGVEREAQARADRGQMLQAEIATLRGRLAQAEDEAAVRAGATAKLQAEIATLRGRLAQAEDEAAGRAGATAKLQSEIAALRGRLVRAEGEAQARGATAAALQAEIAAAQGALAAARQVGKAAIAALRIESATPPKPDGPRGWRRAIMRLLGAETSF